MSCLVPRSPPRFPLLPANLKAAQPPYLDLTSVFILAIQNEILQNQADSIENGDQEKQAIPKVKLEIIQYQHREDE